MNVQNIALSSTNVDFINSDEYDVVSSKKKNKPFTFNLSFIYIRCFPRIP